MDPSLQTAACSLERPLLLLRFPTLVALVGAHAESARTPCEFVVWANDSNEDPKPSENPTDVLDQVTS